MKNSKSNIQYFLENFYKIDKEIKNKFELEKINKLKTSDIFIELQNYEKNFLKLIDLSPKSIEIILTEFGFDSIMKPELEKNILKYTQNIFLQLFSKISEIFKELVLKINLDISKIININYVNINDTFVLQIKELFFSIFKTEFDNFISFFNSFQEMEINNMYFNNNQVQQKINLLYVK